jgi:hypothetical protein
MLLGGQRRQIHLQSYEFVELAQLGWNITRQSVSVEIPEIRRMVTIPIRMVLKEKRRRRRKTIRMRKHVQLFEALALSQLGWNRTRD